ncbi:MAG: hypothetical protein V5A19_09600, partial [Thiohalorhabdus sp.]
VRHRESSKFLYILNQMDATAAEDNPEDVVSSWQRALAQEGLTAGRFYCIYNPEFATPIADEARRQRFEKKRDVDLNEIHERMYRVSVERTYRIVGALEKTVQEIEQQRVPAIDRALRQWARGVWLRDGIALGGVAAVLIGGSVWAGYWQGLSFQPPPWLNVIAGNTVGASLAAAAVVALGIWGHFSNRRRAARRVMQGIESHYGGDKRVLDQVKGAFARSTRPWRSAIRPRPVGWGRGARKVLRTTLEGTDRFIQDLNDRFTNPSGAESSASAAVSPEAEPQEAASAEREETAPAEPEKPSVPDEAGEDKLRARPSDQ